MKPSSRLSILKAAASATVLLLSAGFAGAHGIWIAERHSDLAVVYGHGSSDEGYDPAKLTSLRLLDERGAQLPVQRMDGNDHVTFAKVDGAAVAVSTLDNGFWSKGADGKWVNKSKDEVEDATEGGRYLKYSVTILDHLHDTPKPHGLGFEIVPLADPSVMKAGDTLDVQVLLRGKPVADVVVIAEYTTDSDNRSVRTNADGKASITIRNQGLNVVAASFSEELQDRTRADEVGHFATLTLNLHYHAE
ncbi:MAG: DUF4198 domain-containing protein [Nitratireductor sp.]